MADGHSTEHGSEPALAGHDDEFHLSNEMRLKRIGESVDRLMSLDLWCKFAGEDVVLAMYDAALAKVRPPHKSLTLHAAQALQSAVKPGAQVLICTGLVLPPWQVAESDGPPGAAALARMLNLALKASSVVLVPPRWVEPMRAVVIAAGLTPVADPEILQGQRGACAVLGFPTDDPAAGALAGKWIGSGNVAAVIALETPGRTVNGGYVTGAHGWDISGESSRFDFLFEEANRKGVLTIGIGDHGGELGLGAIADTVREFVPTARPGPADITPEVCAQIPIIAGISNWGAYGLAGLIAAVAGKPELVHDGAAELLILEATARVGFLAGMVGLPVAIVDGMSASENAAFVELLRVCVQRGMQAPYPRAVGFNPQI